MIWYAFASYVTTYYDFLFTGDEAPWSHVLLGLLMGTSWEDCSHRPISCLRWGNWPCVWPLGWPWAPTDRRGKCNELCRWGHRAGLWRHHVDATLSVPHPWMMHILTLKFAITDCDFMFLPVIMRWNYVCFGTQGLDSSTPRKKVSTSGNSSRSMAGDSVDLPKLKGIGCTRKTRFNLYHHIQRGLHHADSISSIDSTNSKRLFRVNDSTVQFVFGSFLWCSRSLLMTNSYVTLTKKKKKDS